MASGCEPGEGRYLGLSSLALPPIPPTPQGSVNTENTAENSPSPGAWSARPEGAVWSRPTCAGVPGLNEPPDDGVTLVTGLLHTLALLLVESVLEKDSDVGLILTGVLGPGRGHR